MARVEAVVSPSGIVRWWTAFCFVILGGSVWLVVWQHERVASRNDFKPQGPGTPIFKAPPPLVGNDGAPLSKQDVRLGVLHQLPVAWSYIGAYEAADGRLSAMELVRLRQEIACYRDAVQAQPMPKEIAAQYMNWFDYFDGQCDEAAHELETHELMNDQAARDNAPDAYDKAVERTRGVIPKVICPTVRRKP